MVPSGPAAATDDFSTPTQAIVLGIAARTGEDPTELPPLSDAVDPDALNALLGNAGTCQVSFTYAGYDVSVAGPRDVEIHQVPDDWPGESGRDDR